MPLIFFFFADDDDDLPPSASQVRPSKRGEKISLKKVDSKLTKRLLPITRTATEVSYQIRRIHFFLC